jgi:uncharacterized protein (TIGR02466 family)
MSLDVTIGRDSSLIFTTPLLRQMMPKADTTNPGLRRLILERMRSTSGVHKSNRGGWQSDTDLLTWRASEIDILNAWIDFAVQRLSRLAKPGPAPSFKADAWANVNRPGDYNAPHVHPGCTWALVYYVDAGIQPPDDKLSGRLELRDPRPAAVHGSAPGFGFGDIVTIQPEPGLMVGFPAWVEHSVSPFKGCGERISIAVNVTLVSEPSNPAP